MIKIETVEKFFKKFVHPNEPILLEAGQTIVNSELFVESHLLTLKKNSGNRGFIPYYNRLIKYYKLCKKYPPKKTSS
jgi:hypothetical protein